MGSDGSPDAPLIFLKPSTVGDRPRRRDPAARSSPTEVDYEGELAVVIGALGPGRAARAGAETVSSATPCANDVTARDQQRHDGQWTRAKGYDSFCPLGPWIETDLDPADLGSRTELNGEVTQDGRTSRHDARRGRRWSRTSRT